jgi:hypothetical protein
MYILIAIFFTGAGTHGSLYTYLATENLGEYSSLKTCQAAGNDMKKKGYAMYGSPTDKLQFVCAKK